VRFWAFRSRREKKVVLRTKNRLFYEQKNPKNWLGFSAGFFLRGNFLLHFLGRFRARGDQKHENKTLLRTKSRSGISPKKIEDFSFEHVLFLTKKIAFLGVSSRG
jgi:hypothetical protein